MSLGKRVWEKKANLGSKGTSLWAQHRLGSDNELVFDKILFSSHRHHLQNLCDPSGLKLRAKALIVGGMGRAETTAPDTKGDI